MDEHMILAPEPSDLKRDDAPLGEYCRSGRGGDRGEVVAITHW